MATGSRVSVVIPSLREGNGLLRCLDALRGCGAADEVIVATHGEDAAVRASAQRDGAVAWVECEQAGRGLQMNAGARAATGDVLCFLHADTQLPRDAATMMRAALAERAVAGGAFRLSFDARHPALDALSLLSAISWRGGFLGDQAMFCRRDLFERIGGFWDRPLFEDVDLADRLSREGRMVRIGAHVRTSARRFVARGPWRQLGQNAVLYARFGLGANVAHLARVYER